MSVGSVLTLHALRRWMFAFSGGYCLTTFFHQSLDYRPPPPTHERYLLFWHREIPPSLGGEEALMLHVRENQFVWAITLTLVTFAGGWFALLGSATSFASYGMEGRARMEKMWKTFMDELGEI